MMKVRSCCGLVCVALVLVLASGAYAQEFRATIKGTVVDTSQAALPGATVTAQNQETNELATAVTNGEGAYTIPFLRPGVYSLSVEMSGFQKNTRTNLRLSVGETANITVTLGVGLTETVNVVSETPLLETSRADRGTVIDSARIAELPLQSRSPMALVVLVAGVNYNAQAIYLRPFDNGALAAWSMNGGQSSNNEFLLDGAPNNANQGGNNIAYVPPAEAVGEMKISTNSYDAQYGRTAGGVVNVSLKAGTNSFHGVVYDFMRRKALAANSFILNTSSRPKTDQYIDQYGFSVDGPIWKNKTFFLFTGEKYREGTPAPLVSTVPTQAMRNGDFSGVVDTAGRQVVIYDPATGRLDANGVVDTRSVPGQHHPAAPDQCRRPAAIMQDLAGTQRGDGRRGAVAAEPAVARALQQGPVLELGRESRPQLRHQRPGLLPLGRERAERDRQQGQRHPRGSRPGRPASALARQPRAGRRLGAHLRAGHGLQPARQLHLFPRVELFRLRDRFRFDGVLAVESGEPDAEPGDRRHLPGAITGSDVATLSRGSCPEPEPQLLDAAERVADPRRPQHPQRSRPAVDQRLQ